MNPKLHLILLIILAVLYLAWFWILLKKPKPKNTYVDVDNISFFRKGQVFEIYKAIHPDDEPSSSQEFKVLRIYPKTKKIKVKEIT